MNANDFQNEIAALTALINSAGGVVPTDMTSPSITSNGFYQAIQTAADLICIRGACDSATLLLIARIATTSPVLTSINICSNFSGDDVNSSEIILTLSKVKSLKSLNIHNNQLGGQANITEIIEGLSNSQLESVDIRNNHFTLIQKNEINKIITARNNDVIVHDTLITDTGIVPELIPELVSLVALCLPDFNFDCDFSGS